MCSRASRASLASTTSARSAASIANCGWPSGTFREQQAHAAGRAAERVREAFGGPAAGGLEREVARPEIEKPPQDIGRDQPAAEQRRQPFAQLPLAQLHEHHGDVGIGLREVPAGAKRPIERLGDEPGKLRLVGQIEARIDVGFERELADERQAEGVDRRNRDLAETLAQRAPHRRGQLRRAACLFQPLDDPLPHLGGGLSGERDREDVLGLDARQQQVDVAFDEHARLARAGRGLEHDVARRIDRAQRARRRQTTSPT